MQAQPQAIDFIFIPIAYLAALTWKNKTYIATSALLIWNHGLVNIATLTPIFLQKLKHRKITTITIITLATLPVLIITAIYLPTALQGYSNNINTDQQNQFWNNPLDFYLNYLRLLTIGFPIAAYYLYKHLKHNKISAAAKLSLAAIACNAIMIPIWPDRWIQYSTIPLTLLIIDHYNTHNLKQKIIWQIVIPMVYTLQYASLWILLYYRLFVI
jgi:hypothetical protein